MSVAPQLDEKMIWTLGVIARGLAGDPSYLEGSDYPAEIQAMLKPRFIDRPFVASDIDVEALDVPSEIEKLFRDLKETREGFATNDSSEKIAYFRIAVSLLEKLVNLNERANNVRRIGNFHNTVLAVLTEFLEPTVITKVRTRLLEVASE